MATQSSIATLPVNLEACENIGVPKNIREIVLPIGGIAHMDGTCFSTILKISFLFGIFDIPFTGISTYISAVLIALCWWCGNVWSSRRRTLVMFISTETSSVHMSCCCYYWKNNLSYIFWNSYIFTCFQINRKSCYRALDWLQLICREVCIF